MLRRTALSKLQNEGEILTLGNLYHGWVAPTAKFAEANALRLRKLAPYLIKLSDKMMGSRPKERMPMMRRLVNMAGHRPQIGPNCFIAPSAVVIGNVKIGRKSSVCYNAVIRGDNGEIEIGEGTCINDKAVIKGRTIIGKYCCIEPMAIVDNAHIASNSFVGSASIVCRGATIESGAMLGAASVLRSGAVIPAGEMWSGNPAQKVSDLTEEEKEQIVKAAKHNILIGVEQQDCWAYAWEDVENHRIAREVWHEWAQNMMELRIKPFYVRQGPAAKQKKDNPLEIMSGLTKYPYEHPQGM